MIRAAPHIDVGQSAVSLSPIVRLFFLFSPNPSAHL